MPDGLNYENLKTAQTNPDGSSFTREQIASNAQNTATLPVPNMQSNSLQGGMSVPDVPLPTSIGSDSLASVPRVSIPTARPSAPTPQMNIADKILQQTMVEDTEAQKMATGLSSRIVDLIPNLVGQSAELNNQRKLAGVDTFKKELQDLNTQILTKQAEINQDDIKLVASMRAEEVRDSLLPFVQSGQAKLAGDAAILRGLKTAEIGVLNARAIAKQGDIQLAIETAQSAVDAKYAPYKEAIELYKQQLEALTPILTRDDAKQARAQQLKTTVALQELEDRRAEEKADAALIFASGLPQKFVNKNGTFIRTSDNKHYEDMNEFFADAGVSSFAEAYSRGLVGDLSPQLIADKDFVMNARNKYYDAGIEYTDTPEQAAEKIKNNSYIFGKETYIEGASGTGTEPKITKIGDKEYVWDEETQTYVDAGLLVDGTVGGENSQQQADKELADQQVTQIDRLLKNSGLNSVVGPNAIARWSIKNALTGKSAEAMGDIQQITSGLVGKTLADLKSQGATFGALSENELRVIQNAATKINAWAIKDKDGNVKGYKVNEKAFREELKKIQDNIKKGYERKYGGGATTSATIDANGNQVKGMRETIAKLPLLNLDGSEKTPNVPLTKAYPQGSYPAGKKNSLLNQCGYFVRSLVNKMGLNYPSVGDSLKQKAEAVKKYGTKLGGIGKVLITNESKKNGHVAYVIGRNAKGWVLAESNYRLDGKVNYGRTIPYNSPAIIGFINPTNKNS